MHFVLLIIGAIIAYFALSKYLSNQPEQFNNLFSKILSVVLGVSAFIILVKGNIAVGVVLATGAVLSWQGSLWSYLKSKAQGPEIGQSAPSSSQTMNREEALSILELTGNPTQDEIKEAHHRLMKKIHPDQGGSEYFASKLNQAKDLLLKS